MPPAVAAAASVLPVSILLALLSSAMWGTSDFAGGLLSRRRPSYAVVGASQAIGLAAATVVALATGGFGEPRDWLLWAVLAGASGALGLVCFYAALASGTMGVVSPIAALGAIVPVAVGVLSGESPTLLAVLGIVLALAGAVAASGPELRGDTGARPVALAAIAGAAFGAALTFLALGADSSPVMTLWGMRATSVTGFALAAAYARNVGGLVARDAPSLAFIGLNDVGANLLFALATQQPGGLVSITSVLASLYPVATVLLAWAILHERLLRVQQLGVAAALAGVALVSLG